MGEAVTWVSDWAPSEEGGVAWLGAEMRALCGGTAMAAEEDKEAQKQVLTGRGQHTVPSLSDPSPPGLVSRLF